MSRGINKRRERRRSRRRPESLLQDEQVVKLQAIGAYLRQAREQQSLSLEQVETLTKIQPRLLSAIEDGKLDQLPEPVFVQGYIKLFAQALGLDGSAFAAAFPTDVSMQLPTLTHWRSLPKLQLRPVHLYCLYACLIFAAVNGLSYLLGDPSLPKVIEVTSLPAQSDDRVAKVVNADRATDSPARQATVASLRSLDQLTAQLPFSNAIAADASKPLQVGIRLQEQSWLRVEADGKTLFEGVLAEGTEQAWSADKTLIVRAGNAGGVLVAINNGQSKPMGEPGAVEEMTIAANTSTNQPSTGLLPASHPSN